MDYTFYIILSARRLNKDHVSSGSRKCIASADSLIHSSNSNGIGPRVDHKIRVRTSSGSSLNFLHRFIEWDNLFSRHMSTAFWEELIFNIYAGSTRRSSAAACSKACRVGMV